MNSFDLPPSAFRLWGLARWGHENSSTARHPSTRVLPPAPSVMILTAPSCITFLLALPTNGLSTLLRQTLSTIRAFFLFVGHVCDQLQPPSGDPSLPQLAHSAAALSMIHSASVLFVINSAPSCQPIQVRTHRVPGWCDSIPRLFSVNIRRTRDFKVCWCLDRRLVLSSTTAKMGKVPSRT